MDDLFMLDDMDLAVRPIDDAVMDDYIMELANMSTTPAHMQGESEAMLTVAPPDSACCHIRSCSQADGLLWHLCSGNGTPAAELLCTP